jgi:hypothetical protein
MISARQKGLNFTREVRDILEGLGHIVDGPFYGIAFYNGRQNPIHRDLFGCFDLMSFDGEYFLAHQVSTIENKSAKIKAIQNKGLRGSVWCRFTDEDGRVGYQLYSVEKDEIIESEMVYEIKRRRKVKEIS